ncbi:MAG: HU family DNA-binding protein [Planctomycetales bacterium]|nr:HU family DNA-binding protein [Planctomycetales bacterium]
MPIVSTSDLVRAVAAATGTPAAAVRRVVESFLDQLVKEVARGRRVAISKYFTVYTKVRKPRRMRHPQTGLPIDVPARSVLAFRPGSKFRKWAEAKLPSALFYGGQAPGRDKKAPEAAPPEGGGLQVEAGDVLDALGRLEKPAPKPPDPPKRQTKSIPKAPPEGG